MPSLNRLELSISVLIYCVQADALLEGFSYSQYTDGGVVKGACSICIRQV